MKIGITTTDGKNYILANEYESIGNAMQYMISMYSPASLTGINHFAYVTCEDNVRVFVDKIVSVFEIH